MSSDRTLFRLTRPPILSPHDLEQIEEAALRLLDQVGLAIVGEGLQEALAARGWHASGGRIRIPRRRAEAFLAGERARSGHDLAALPAPAPPEAEPAPADAQPAPRLTLGVSPYPQRVHDLASDAIVPYDTQRLIEATKLTHVLGIQGPPGCPADVAPALQPIVQYWVSATTSRYGRRPVDPKTAESLPYVMAMAEALGHPLRRLPVYVFSPLTLGGESLRCVMQARERLSAVNVSSMASAGMTAPIHMGDAFAQAAAEVIGPAILLQDLLELPVTWGVDLFAADLRSLMMVFGSPESYLLQLASAEVNAYLHGRPWAPAAANLHTNAKIPGAQACAEKASLMTTGALLGARHFYPAGTLSLDEVFSAEQCVVDVEIAAHVERLVGGLDTHCDPERCLADVTAGIDARGIFVGLEATVQAYREVYWHPDLFVRGSFSAWEGRGAVTDRATARARVRALLRSHAYELERDLVRELDLILADAKAALG